MRRTALLCGGACAALLACRPVAPEAEELAVRGALERDGISGRAPEEVEISYRSAQARAEWWPCELRLTAAGCVGDHHVNVYVGLPDALALEDLGGNGCVVDGEPRGVFEALLEKPSRSIGTELSAFILVASDVNGEPGALLEDDEETTAASRLATGTLTVHRLNADDGALALTIEAETTESRRVEVSFGGPVRDSRVVPLEGPSTCVDSALLPE